MSDVTATRAREEAAAWFARLSKRSVTTDSLREFRDWSRDPRNAAAYREVETTWRAAGALAQDRDIRGATEAALQRKRSGIHRSPAFRWGCGIAGIIVAGTAATVALSPPTYRTTIGEQRLVMLPDGTRMHLNTDSIVRVRFRPSQRDVDLDHGEALFEVAHDNGRPFVVHSEGARVRAVGTKFDVRRGPNATQVTLLEGRVEVSDGGAVATLSPNQQVTAGSGRGLSRPKAADVAQATSWTTGRLIFHSQSLAEATGEVNRYARRKIQLDVAPELSQLPVSGVFDTGDSAAFVAAVTNLFDLQADQTADHIRLSPRSKGPEA